MGLFKNLFKIAYSKKELDAIERHVEEHFGEIGEELQEVSPNRLHTDILIIPPHDGREFYTLVTEGMGAYKMKVPKDLSGKKLDRAELVMTLPAHWNLQSEDERWRWPIRVLGAAAHLPFDCGDWLGYGHSIGGDDDTPFASNTQLNSLLLVMPEKYGTESFVCTLPNGDEVNFYEVIPLYREELEYKLKYGAGAIMNRLDDLAFYVDPVRPNVITDDYYKNLYDVMDSVASHSIKIPEKGLNVEEKAAGNHIAVYLRRAIELGLMSEEFRARHAQVISGVLDGSGTDLRAFLNDALGGELRLSYFNEEGRDFSLWYYHQILCDDPAHSYPADVDRYAEEYFGTDLYNSDEFRDEAYLFLPFDENYYATLARAIDESLELYRKETP